MAQTSCNSPVLQNNEMASTWLSIKHWFKVYCKLIVIQKNAAFLCLFLIIKSIKSLKTNKRQTNKIQTNKLYTNKKHLHALWGISTCIKISTHLMKCQRLISIMSVFLFQMYLIPLLNQVLLHLQKLNIFLRQTCLMQVSNMYIIISVVMTHRK